MKNKDIAKHFFARNPEVDALFITSNDKGFLTEHQADAYAQRLKDRKVVKVERKDLSEKDVTPPPAKETITDTTAAVGGKPVETKTEPGDEDVNGDGDQDDLDILGFEELKALADEKGIDHKELKLNSKDKIREAIRAKDKEATEDEGEGTGADQGEGDGTGTGEGDKTGEGDGAGEGDGDGTGAGEGEGTKDVNDIDVNDAETLK